MAFPTRRSVNPTNYVSQDLSFLPILLSTHNVPGYWRPSASLTQMMILTGKVHHMGEWRSFSVPPTATPLHLPIRITYCYAPHSNQLHSRFSLNWSHGRGKRHMFTTRNWFRKTSRTPQFWFTSVLRFRLSLSWSSYPPVNQKQCGHACLLSTVPL